ncbi:hypothetical protein BGW80DRAFT_1255078 [Lactifluus volemus]|nr:hypothetical protein BGW80DRAFT_1255078 [Lactifluus volemus]
MVVQVPSRAEIHELTASEEADNRGFGTRCNESPCLNALYLQRDEIPIGSWPDDEDEFIFTVLQLHVRWSTRPLTWSKLADDDIEHSPMIGDVNLFFKNPREDPEFDVECEMMARRVGSEP